MVSVGTQGSSATGGRRSARLSVPEQADRHQDGRVVGRRDPREYIVCSRSIGGRDPRFRDGSARARSEEHTSELQSLMRISYAVFCLKTKKPTCKQIQ